MSPTQGAAMNALLDPCASLPWGDCALECLNPLNWMAPRGLRKMPPCANSFTGETPVHVKPQEATAETAQQGKAELKPVSQIRVGDEVLAFAEWQDKGKTPGKDERLSYEKVTDIFTSYREQRLIQLTLETGETITATEGHPFRTTEGWRDAILLKRGGKLLLKGAGEEPDPAQPQLRTGVATQDGERVVAITEIRTERKTIQVYNLEVANAHTFFVGEEGVLGHNIKGGNRGKNKRCSTAKTDSHNGLKGELNDLTQKERDGGLTEQDQDRLDKLRETQKKRPKLFKTGPHWNR
jgi:hypothetical protein